MAPPLLLLLLLLLLPAALPFNGSKLLLSCRTAAIPHAQPTITQCVTLSRLSLVHYVAVLLQLCWQPLGVPLGMSMRALLHKWVMFHNIKVGANYYPLNILDTTQTAYIPSGSTSSTFNQLKTD
jgi:hypothetical protein